MTVAGDVKTIAENMGVLESLLMSMHDKLVSKIREFDDDFAEVSIKNAHELYNKLINELRRQTALLTNIVSDTIPKYEDDIVELVRESGALKETVEHISDKLGTKAFGQKLGYLLAGMDNVAQSALMVDKALDDVVLEWRRSPLNPSRYNVYRSTVAADLQLIPGAIGIRPASATPNDETWDDIGAVDSGEWLYFYRVLGRECDDSGTLP